MGEVRQGYISVGRMERYIASPKPKPKEIRVSRVKTYCRCIGAFPCDVGLRVLALDPGAPNNKASNVSETENKTKRSHLGASHGIQYCSTEISCPGHRPASFRLVGLLGHSCISRVSKLSINLPTCINMLGAEGMQIGALYLLLL